MQELVYRPYLEHLSDFDPDELPEEIKPVFEAVSEKLASGEPIKDFGSDEAAYFSEDIRYLLEVIRSFNH